MSDERIERCRDTFCHRRIPADAERKVCDRCWKRIEADRKAAEKDAAEGKSYDYSNDDGGICDTDRRHWAEGRDSVKGKWGGKQW